MPITVCRNTSMPAVDGVGGVTTTRGGRLFQLLTSQGLSEKPAACQ